MLDRRAVVPDILSGQQHDAAAAHHSEQNPIVVLGNINKTQGIRAHAKRISKPC